MASETIMAGPRIGQAPFWQSDVVKSVAAMLIVAAIAAVGGFGNLAGTEDNDSALRLVEVRDLIAGQGWFDLHQYRMGAGGGLLMHWSRLVDAPIAVIVLLATAVTGSQEMGETAALIVWPLVLFGVALYLLLKIGRLVANEQAMFPLLVIGGTTLHYNGTLSPGAIDHHNVQLVLMLAMVYFLLRAGKEPRASWLAGVCAVLMLAVGMETVPYVAVGGLFVAGWWLVSGREARDATIGFGTAFAATSASVFFATVPAAEWTSTYCDAYSVAQFAMGTLAGAGLAAIAASRPANATPIRRTAALVVLGGVVATLAVLYFPQCLSDPYADLGPVLRTNWLDLVGEAQPLWSMLTKEPEAAVGHYATVLIALAVLAMRMRKTGLRRDDVLIASMLLGALLVSVWQVRGSRFSAPLACVPLAIWVAEWRSRAEAAPGAASSLKLVGAWLVSFDLAWKLAGLGLWYVLSPAAAEDSPVAKGDCYKRADYAQLAEMPRDNVLAISNLGAPVLRHTHHRVLAGPYHRNLDGNLATLEAFMGSPQQAEEIARTNDVGLVALCPGNGEGTFLSGRAPDGLLADLLAGKIPDWLEAVPKSKGKPLELYRVMPR